VISLRILRSAEENFGSTRENLGAPATSLGAPRITVQQFGNTMFLGDAAGTPENHGCYSLFNDCSN